MDKKYYFDEWSHSMKEREPDKVEELREMAERDGIEVYGHGAYLQMAPRVWRGVELKSKTGFVTKISHTGEVIECDDHPRFCLSSRMGWADSESIFKAYSDLIKQCKELDPDWGK